MAVKEISEKARWMVSGRANSEDILIKPVDGVLGVHVIALEKEYPENN